MRKKGIILMLSKKTIIGIIVGSAIIAIGISSLIISIGLQTIEVNEKLSLEESTSFLLYGPALAEQTLKITGESFDVKIENSEDGELVPLETKKNEFSFTWIHQKDGTSIVDIDNVGKSELEIEAVFQVTTDLLVFSYHFIVIIAGIVIIGFSSGFSVKKS